MSEWEIEYADPVKLEGDQGVYFLIPDQLIFGWGDGDDSDSDAEEMGKERLAVFSFFSIRRGLDSKVLFSVNRIVEWCGRKPNRSKGGINERLSKAILQLADAGYLELSGELGNSSLCEARFCKEKVKEACDNGWFAIVYLDEARRILDYRNPNTKDSYLNSSSVFLVFAYLRMRIMRRGNRNPIPELKYLPIEERRTGHPEAYDCYYTEIAEDLGLSERTVSGAVGILNELGLIYSKALPREKVDGEWKTSHTIFCNRDKREGGYLLDSGRGYYLRELKNKELRLKNLTKSKRKKRES